jgi:hypothetical protein
MSVAGTYKYDCRPARHLSLSPLPPLSLPSRFTTPGADISGKKAFMTTIKQIIAYDWIDDAVAAQLVDRLQEAVFYGDLTAADVEYLKFEQYMAANVTKEEFPFLHEDVKLTGRMDIQVRSSAPHLGPYLGLYLGLYVASI